MTNETMMNTINTTAARIYDKLEKALSESDRAEESLSMIRDGFDPSDNFTSVYIVPMLESIAADCGMTADTFCVDEDLVVEHFVEVVTDALPEREAVRPNGETERNTIRYFLDFDPFDQDSFCLMTTDGHDTVYEGRLSEIVKPGDDWQDALDRHFEKTLGILPGEWEIG